jgi:uncharacterized protein
MDAINSYSQRPALARCPSRGAIAMLWMMLLTMLLGTPLALAQGGRDAATPSQPTITVSGTAEIAVDPDQATVRFGVTALAADAAAAQDQVNQVMRRVLDAVRALDVPERAVRTEQLWLSPQYAQVRPRPAQEEPDEPRIVGYRAGNVVSVVVDDLAKIGPVIDASIGAGANQLQGISFDVRDDAAARNQALQQAVGKARSQADAIATAMGLRVTGVAQVIAGGASVGPPMPMYDVRMETMAATPVQPGQIDVSASVTVVYHLAEGAARGR